MEDFANFLAEKNVFYLPSQLLLPPEKRALIGKYFPNFENFALVDGTYAVVETLHPVISVNFARQFNIGNHVVPSLQTQTTFFAKKNGLFQPESFNNPTNVEETSNGVVLAPKLT